MVDVRGFEGDPGHEGSEKPQKHLQGTMTTAYVQPVMNSANDSNSNQHDAPVHTPWTASLGPKPGGTRGTKK